MTEPGYLKDWEEFCARFVTPIKRGSASDASPEEKSIRKKLMHKLNTKMGLLMHRKDKDTIAALIPAKTEVVLCIPLGERERKVHELATESLKESPKLLLFASQVAALTTTSETALAMAYNTFKDAQKKKKEDDELEESTYDMIIDAVDQSAAYLNHSLDDGYLSNKLATVKFIVEQALSRSESIVVYASRKPALILLDRLLSTIPTANHLIFWAEYSQARKQQIIADFKNPELNHNVILLPKKV